MYINAYIHIRDFPFGGGGGNRGWGISIYEKEGGVMIKRGVSAPPLPSQMSQAALSGGQSLGEGGLLLGGGGGWNPRFPPLYETLHMQTVYTNTHICTSSHVYIHVFCL